MTSTATHTTSHNEAVLAWPPLDSTPVESREHSPVGRPADTSIDTSVDVWDYFAENIDDFAVAKSLVDHFDANPKHLFVPAVDTFGLYLRAKVTLKRQAVAFATAQAAVTKAREESRGVRGVLKSFKAFVSSVRSAVESNPTPIAATVALVALYLVRH